MVLNKNTQIGRFHKIPQFFDAIKFQESIFALPFAYTGMILSVKGFPGWIVLLWITIAMVSARTFGMIANRVIDKEIDKLIKTINPMCLQIKFISLSSTENQTTLNLDLKPKNFHNVTKIQEVITGI